MISINVNPAASGAGLNLGKANAALQKSISRLSSGRRIVTSSDDAGGLAVSMKMAAAQKRTEATAVNLRNIVSFLDTQDGAFKIADKVLSRMSELTTLARDVTKNAGDVENYDKEFQNLQDQMRSLATEKFNGVNLFNSNSTGAKFDVPTSEDGSQQTTVTQAPLASEPTLDMMINGFHSFEINGVKYVAPSNIDRTFFTAYELPGGVLSPVTISGHLSTNNPSGGATYTVTVGAIPSGSEAASSNIGESNSIVRMTVNGLNANTYADFVRMPDDDGVTVLNDSLSCINSDYDAVLSQEALQQVADMRAQNGAEMSRTNFAQDLLDINAMNLEAANSRIMDVNVAAESSQLARFQILQQAGTAMLAQANTSQQSLVRLLQG